MIRLEDIIQLKDDEKVRAMTRRHGITVFPPLLLAFVLIVTPFFFLFPLFSSGPTGVVAFIALVVTGAIVAFRTLVMWDGDIIVVTNKRLVDVEQQGIFARTVNEIVIENIQDCSWSKQNIIGLILNIGYFKARSASGSLTIEAKHVPHPQELQHLVNEIRDEATRPSSSGPTPKATVVDDHDDDEDSSPEREVLLSKVAEQIEQLDEEKLRELSQTLKDEDRDITIKRLFSDGEEPKEMKEEGDRDVVSTKAMPRFSITNLFKGRAWPVILIGTTVLVFVIGIATVRESYGSWKVDREILALSAQADALEGRNAKLRELAQALQQPERVEVEARTRLGLRGPGEHVVVLNGLAATSSWQGSLALDVVEDKPFVEKTNPQLWFDYFFRPNQL